MTDEQLMTAAQFLGMRDQIVTKPLYCGPFIHYVALCSTTLFKTAIFGATDSGRLKEVGC